MQNKVIIGGLLLAMCSAAGCAAPYDSNGGSQIGSLWSAYGNIIRVKVWGLDSTRIASDVVVGFEDRTISEQSCEASGFCGVIYAQYGEYEIAVTVAEQAQSKTIILDEQDLVEIDPDDCELTGCEPWAQELVEFFFSE